MLKFSLFFLLCHNVLFSLCKLVNINDEFVRPESYFVYWQNATIPFYINPEHFDSEQSLSILTSLSLFAFKTCLKFAPVMAEPVNHHVLVIENPNGKRNCEVNNAAHTFEDPHRITLGYECLKPPKIDMMIMRALGFPFEHNRASRDVYINVQFENIQPGSIELFTKDVKLPPELRTLPYDVNSVMHFSDREFSKNGHRTIIFKNHNTKQNRVSLTPTDLRKIEIVYGPECQKRDRQAKIDLCQHYPGLIRKKRETDAESTRSLRVNPEITPPQDQLPEEMSRSVKPDITPPQNLPEEMSRSIKDLGIVDEVQNIVEDVYKLTAIALKNARVKYCNDSKESLRSDPKRKENNTKSDILGIIEVITDYTQTVVDNAVSNLTEFCETSQSIDKYVRSRCGWYDSNNNRCRLTYKSTKSGAVKYSTQHRPVYYQSTKHKGRAVVYNYDHMGYRAGPEVENSTDNTNITNRKKRSVDSDKITTDSVSAKEIKEINTDLTKTQNNTAMINQTEDVNSIKSILRMATTIHFKKKDNYAPIWRRSKQNRFKQINQNPEDVLEPIKNARTRRSRYKKKSGEKIEVVEKEFEEESQQHRPGNKLRKRVPKTVTLSRENKEFYDERKWPENVVRFIITDDSRYNIQDLRSRLEEVNNILKGKTCVHLEEITDTDMYNDYLVLDISPDYVTGRVGGRQIFGSVELFEGGQHRQHAAMMVMAMLGFYFEISRHDRDDYIRVHNRHIRPDKLHHFEKIRSDATLPLPYDYESATHPAWQFWRKLGKRGISTVATYKDKDPNGTIMKSLGQNEKLLSKYDLIKINSVYGIDCFHSQRRMKITSDN